MDTISQHIIVEFGGCDKASLNNEKRIRGIIQRAAEDGYLTVLNISSRKYVPYGVSAIAFLTESHLSIHTWPEVGYAAVDLFTCGHKHDLNATIQSICLAIRPSSITWSQLERGRRTENSNNFDHLITIERQMAKYMKDDDKSENFSLTLKQESRVFYQCNPATISFVKNK